MRLYKAEEKAAAEAEANLQEEEVKTAIATGVESGAERLMEDIRTPEDRKSILKSLTNTRRI